MRKRPCLRSCGKRCLRAVGKPAAFPSSRECLFSIGGAAVFHISIVHRVSLFDKGLGLSQQAIFVFRGRGPPKPKIRQWVLAGCACYRNPFPRFSLYQYYNLKRRFWLISKKDGVNFLSHRPVKNNLMNDYHYERCAPCTPLTKKSHNFFT